MSRLYDQSMARKLYSQSRHQEELEVECWCQEHIVKVPPPEIIGGKTRSCGSYACDYYGRKAVNGHKPRRGTIVVDLK